MRPVDMTTRKTRLEAAIEAAAVGGPADTAARDDALEFALDGLDLEAFYVQSVYRYNINGRARHRLHAGEHQPRPGDIGHYPASAALTRMFPRN